MCSMRWRRSLAWAFLLCLGRDWFPPVHIRWPTSFPPRLGQPFVLVQNVGQGNLCLAAAQSGCVKALPPSLRKSLASSLCEKDSPASRQAAQCAAVAKKRTSLSNDQIGSLCRGSVSTLPALCAASLKAKVPSAVKVSLCRDLGKIHPPPDPASAEQRASGPARCFSLLPKSFPDVQALALCRGAASGAPASCAVQSLNVPARNSGGSSKYDIALTLCEGATNMAPAECLGLLKGPQVSKLSGEQRGQLCRGAVSTAPAECALTAPSSLSANDRLRLCKGRSANGTDPADCVRGTGKALQHDVEEQIRLCAGARGNGVTECAQAAPFGFNASLKALLCMGAPSVGPAACIKNIRSLRLYQEDELREAAILCQGAKSEVVAACFDESPRELPAESRRALCKGAVSTAPATCAALGHNKVPRNVEVAVCQGVVAGTAPMDCAMTAPYGFSEEDIMTLCRNADPRASRCAVAAPSSLTSTQKASLCARATSNAPAECAHAAPLSGKDAKQRAVELCVGAKDSTPGKCASFVLVQQGRDLDAATTQFCRGAVAQPSSLRILRMWWDSERGGDAIYAKSNVHIVLELLDQFGSPLSTNNRTVVSASVDPRSSGGSAEVGGVLEGLRTNMTVNGVATLNYLRFSHAGTYDVHFAIDGSRVETLRVNVATHEDDNFGPTGLCGHEFFTALSSFTHPASASSGKQSRATRSHNRSHSQASSDGRSQASHPLLPNEEVARLPWNHVWRLYGCLANVQSAGVRIVNGWDGDLWVWYRPAMLAMDTGSNLPTSAMSWWERLGVSEGASEGLVKKAYYRLSLVWHPDRWASYPLYKRQAQDIFELISEAYTGLALGS